MNLYGLIGYPLSHSFSKKYFSEKFEQEGIPATYQLFPIHNIEALPGLIKEHPGLKGLNVTIPYKKEVLHLLDDISNIPAGLSACNCIRIDAGKTYGFNTDCTGFEKSILPLLKSVHKKAMILGNGGAAEAVKFVFEKNNIPYSIVGRRLNEEVSLLYQNLTHAIITAHTIIVNTTPLGMFPDTDTCPSIPYQAIGESHLLYDLVYNPSKTLFLTKGEERGATVKNGYEMLQVQAEESWKIWNG